MAAAFCPRLFYLKNSLDGAEVCVRSPGCPQAMIRREFVDCTVLVIAHRCGRGNTGSESPAAKLLLLSLHIHWMTDAHFFFLAPFGFCRPNTIADFDRVLVMADGEVLLLLAVCAFALIL